MEKGLNVMIVEDDAGLALLLSEELKVKDSQLFITQTRNKLLKIFYRYHLLV